MIPYNYAEEEVYAFIKSRCSEDEEVQFMPWNIFRDHRNSTLIPDIYLPKGCRRLNIKPKTCIEVKANLNYNTFDRLREMYDIIHSHFKEGNFHLMLVTMERVEQLKTAYSGPRGRDIEIVYFYDWLKKETVDKNITESAVDNLLSTDLKSAQKAFTSGPNTFFLGAGVSCSEGLPGWENLLIAILSDATKTKVRKDEFDALFKANGSSSIIMGRYIRRLYNDDKQLLKNAIRDCLYKNRALGDIKSGTIKKICELVKKYPENVKSIITYNYDDLIEQQLEKIGVASCSVFDTHEPDGRFPVYHVHGILDQRGIKSSEIVLSEDDYHEQYRRSFMWSNVEQLHALQNNNCFFIGLSMTDPNLRRLLDFTKSEANDKNQRDSHCFAFLMKDSVTEGVKSDKKQFLEEQKYMLENLGVRVIWYNNHNELPNLLDKLQKP